MNQSLESRIQSLLDGTITEIEFQHLDDELTANPEARQIYYNYVALHQGLEYRLSRTFNSAANFGDHALSGLSESRLHRQRQKTQRWALLSAAALLLISLVTMRFFFIETAPPVTPVDFTVSQGTLITLSHDREVSDGSHLGVESRLQISQGAVELQFASGVRAIVQGPADITLQEEDLLYMDSGIAWFHVPENARGFTVLTRELKIVDLGTKFGVISDPQIDDEVHVFLGKVKIEALHGMKKETTLTSNQAALVRPYGRFHNPPPQAKTFLTTLPQSLPHLHWSFDDQDELLTTNTLRNPQDIQYQMHTSGNPSGAANLTEGVFGKALSLDGISDYIETDWTGILGDRPRSVAFWIKMPNLRNAKNSPQDSNTIIAWGKQQDWDSENVKINSKWTIHLRYLENQPPTLHISYGGFWYFSPDIILDDNIWHHVAVTYESQSDQTGNPITTLYIDGKVALLKHSGHTPMLRDKDNNIPIDTIDSTPLVIGAELSRDPEHFVRNHQFLQAEIDELFIIEGSIDLDDVLQLMKSNRLAR